MELVRSIWATGALLIPGMLVARALGLGAGATERAVLGCAVGRVLLAGVTLAGTALGLPVLTPAWGCLGWAMGLLALGRRALAVGAGTGSAATRAPASASVTPAIALLVAVSATVCFAVVGRSGLAASDGALVFFGRHPTNDSLVYAALAAQVRSAPLPLPNPFVAGIPNLGHSLFFAELAGLSGVSGLGGVDVAFRLRPLIDVTALVLTAFALARRVGATPLGALLGGLLVLLGGGLSQPIFWIAKALGAHLNELEIWAYGTSFLAPFNPVAPGAQTAWSALLLLCAATVSRRSAVVAGLLVAAVFELKATLWLSVLPALALVAWASRAGVRARRARLASVVALLASLPLVAASPGVAPAEGELAASSLRFCLACVPRFAVASAIQDPFAMVRLFDGFAWSALASPRFWIGSAASSALYLVVTLGAVLLAWPLTRGADRHEDASAARFAARVLGVALALGALASCAFDTPPHFVNAAQFAWCAALGGWPLLGVRLGRWIDAGRAGRAALVLAAALPTGLWWIVAHGAGAPVTLRVTSAERALAAAAARSVPPEALVLDPTFLVEPGRASSIAWLSGRRLYASKEGMLAYLPAAERARRVDLLRRVYQGSERATAEAALADTGVRFLVRTDGLGAALDGSPMLRPLFANEAGSLSEVIPRDGP